MAFYFYLWGVRGFAVVMVVLTFIFRFPISRTRDIIHEKPTKDEIQSSAVAPQKRLARGAVIHTTSGDIHIKLFSEQFVSHFSFPLVFVLFFEWVGGRN